MKKIAPSDSTSEASQSNGQANGLWETHGLMNHIDKANFTTIGNRKLCSTIALTEERFEMPLAQRFINVDVAQMVERSPYMRQVRGLMPRISNFSVETGNKKGNTVSCFVRPKEDMELYVQYGKGSTWNSTELAEKAISGPNRQGLPQKDVEGNITLLTSESKTTVWHKHLMWTPLARHVKRKGKRLACEKHMDWWTTSTKPISERYEIEDCVQLMHQQKKAFRCH